MGFGLSLTGSFDALQVLDRELLKLGNDQVRRDINMQVAHAELAEIQIGFARSVDPYDHPWDPLKRRHGQPLLDTGRLRNSFSVSQVSAKAFTVGTSVEYAGPHQDGAIVHRTPRINVHSSRSGRFLKQASGASTKYRNATLSFSGPHTITIPRRQMLPENEWGRRWWSAIEKVVAVEMTARFGG